VSEECWSSPGVGQLRHSDHLTVTALPTPGAPERGAARRSICRCRRTRCTRAKNPPSGRARMELRHLCRHRFWSARSRRFHLFLRRSRRWRSDSRRAERSRLSARQHRAARERIDLGIDPGCAAFSRALGGVPSEVCRGSSMPRSGAGAPAPGQREHSATLPASPAAPLFDVRVVAVPPTFLLPTCRKSNASSLCNFPPPRTAYQRSQMPGCLGWTPRGFIEDGASMRKPAVLYSGPTRWRLLHW
jgi:hypothetical protein